MFGLIKTLVADVAGHPSSRTNGQNGRLATAALLTRVATVHSEMSFSRRKVLHTVLKSRFALEDGATDQLIDEAAAIESVAIDLYHFTRQLNEVLDDDGRHRTVRMMWELVYADGDPNDFEANIIWRAADLLGVSSRKRIELRQQIAADARLVA